METRIEKYKEQEGELKGKIDRALDLVIDKIKNINKTSESKEILDSLQKIQTRLYNLSKNTVYLGSDIDLFGQFYKENKEYEVKMKITAWQKITNPEIRKFIKKASKNEDDLKGQLEKASSELAQYSKECDDLITQAVKLTGKTVLTESASAKAVKEDAKLSPLPTASSPGHSSVLDRLASKAGQPKQSEVMVEEIKSTLRLKT